MSKDVFFRVKEEISENIDHIKVVVLYHGGEPLLNARFYEMISVVRNILPLATIKTVTNGVALNKENIRKIIESEIDIIEISLDGQSSDENQLIRRNSVTINVINNVKDLISTRNCYKSKKPSVFISTTQFLRSTNTVFPIDVAKTPNWLIENFGDQVLYKATYALRWPHMGTGEYDLLLDHTAVPSNYCDHTEKTITIRYDGDVVPCCYDLTSKLVMGNIMQKSLKNIWNGSRYAYLRKSIESGKHVSICRTCSVVSQPVYLIPRETNAVNIPVEKLVLSKNQTLDEVN